MLRWSDLLMLLRQDHRWQNLAEGAVRGQITMPTYDSGIGGSSVRWRQNSESHLPNRFPRAPRLND